MFPDLNDDAEMSARPTLVLQTSAAKRVFSVGILYVLAGLLGFVLFVHPPGDLVWLVFLAVMVAGTVWLALRTQASRGWLELREDGLYLNGADLICSLDDIASVNRGVFAFKPSNGFLLRMKDPGPRRWAPGLYWRLGPFLGVGGATHKAQADVMSETIALELERRAIDRVP